MGCRVHEGGDVACVVGYMKEVIRCGLMLCLLCVAGLEYVKVVMRDGRMQGVEITLSDWIFSAINAKGKDILTISRDYFRLRKPLERRLYELARKCCGQNKKWHFRVKTLHERTGSTSTLKEFRRMLKNIIETNTKHQHIPELNYTECLVAV